MSHESLKEKYRKTKPDTWILDCREATTLEDCIKLAATAKNNRGDKHPHQRRISINILEEFAEKRISIY